jgi:hypothetical protein
MKKIIIIFLMFTSIVFCQAVKNNTSSSFTSVDILHIDKTVNLISSMTTANIQDSINAQPSNLGGHILTFQFADGTYTSDTTLTIKGFSNGTVYFQGNRTETNHDTLHTTQQVIFDYSSLSKIMCFKIINNNLANLYVQNIKFYFNSSKAIYTSSNSGYVRLLYNYFLGTHVDSSEIAIDLDATNGIIEWNYFSTVGICVGSYLGATVFSGYNLDTGTKPYYGIEQEQSIVGMANSNPDATISKFITHNGFTENKLPGLVPNVSYTVHLDASMSTATIQSILNHIPRYIPYGITLTVQFNDGTYTLTAPLTITGFFGGGQLNIQGNISEANATALHTTQSVFLDFSGQSPCNGLYISGNSVLNIFVKNFKIAVSSANDNNGILAIDNSCQLTIDYNYIYGTAITEGRGISFVRNSGWAVNNYVSTLLYGITAVQAFVASRTNDDTGTSPAYGLYATRAAVIGKDSTQPTGSTSDEITDSGGVIR